MLVCSFTTYILDVVNSAALGLNFDGPHDTFLTMDETRQAFVVAFCIPSVYD